MKKIIAVMLSLAMLLCAASAMAEETGKTIIGTLSINGAFTLQCGLPDGYKPYPRTVRPDLVTAIIKSEDPNAPVMQLSVAYDEMYYDVERMNDLDEEALTLLEDSFIVNDPSVEITYGETGYGTLLLIARHESDEMDYVTFFSIYKGYCVEFALVPAETAEDKNLTEEQLRLSVDFLTELDFIPANEPIRDRQTVANGTYVTNLTNYDAETNTLQAEVKRAITLDEDTLTNLQVGDTLNIGPESILVEKIETDEYGATVNDEISLVRSDNVVRVFLNEHEYMETIANLTLQVPEGLVFLDNIDPETGETLEDPAVYTAADLIRMMQEEEAPGFASDNVSVTFDENGEMTHAERFYTPWQ